MALASGLQTELYLRLAFACQDRHSSSRCLNSRYEERRRRRAWQEAFLVLSSSFGMRLFQIFMQESHFTKKDCLHEREKIASVAKIKILALRAQFHGFTHLNCLASS